MRLNNLEQVRLIQAALSDHAGTANLRVAEDEHAGHNTLGDFCYQVATLRYDAVPLVPPG